MKAAEFLSLSTALVKDTPRSVIIKRFTRPASAPLLLLVAGGACSAVAAACEGSSRCMLPWWWWWWLLLPMSSRRSHGRLDATAAEEQPFDFAFRFGIPN